MTPEKEREQRSPGPHGDSPEPRGFGEHSRGLSGEYAHEQGWGLAVEERTKIARNPDGGSDYDYGAQDFGDEPVNVASAQVPDEAPGKEKNKKRGSAMSKQSAHQEPEELKKHGDPLQNDNDPVPAPENGGHARSHAAHLGGEVHESTKPVGGLKHGVTQGELREPPQVTNRVGKEHRKQ